MEKINIAEILKDCPSGIELDCAVFDNVYFNKVDNHLEFPIECYILCGERKLSILFTKYGEYSILSGAKCTIFPKDKNTWEGFVPPCKFKDGDIISNGRYVAIFHKIDNIENCVNPNVIYYHCWYNNKNTYHKFKAKIDFGIGTFEEYKYATEKEKQKLFDAIKENGYKWNEETKTLEELVPNKFDVINFEPFMKVLVRDNNEQFWTCDWFSFHDTKQVYPFACIGHYVSQCIPFEGNEHLLGTTQDCDEFYKNW